MNKKKTCLITLVLTVILASCAAMPKYTYSFFNSFDTLIDITVFAETEEECKEFAYHFEERMLQLHKLFDIYNDYEGINNIKTINDNAGIKSVVVDRELLDLIVLGKQWYEKSGGSVNIAMGPVLQIWHEYRETYKGDPNNANLPSTEELENAYRLCDINDVIIDENASTVYLSKKGMSLDVGSVAKGYAVQLIAGELSDSAVKNYLINAGGNVLTKGKPQDTNRVKWGVGITNPFASDENNSLLETLFVTDCAIVTSGDYQRYFMADGKIMGHIISPSTLMPAQNFRSVTIIAEDSGIADLLSTTLFIMPYEDGLNFIKQNGAEAIWVFSDGTIKATDGAKPLMKNAGNADAKK